MRTKKIVRFAILVVVSLIGVVQHTRAQTVLRVDFDERNVATPLTQPGYSSFIISSNVSATTRQTNATTRVFGGYSVSISNTVDNGYDDAQRATPVNGGALSVENIYRDVVYSRSSGNNGGLDVRIDGLLPDQEYEVSVWSFDSGALGTRISDWTANGDLVRSDWTFSGSVLPTTDDQYRFPFGVTSDATGAIVIQARRDSNSVDQTGLPASGVFINALEIAQVPEPSTFALVGLGVLALLGRRIRRV